MGMNIHDRDYDERTALHVAASEGQLDCLNYVLSKWKESPGDTAFVDLNRHLNRSYSEPQDKFKRTPLDDAKQFDHHECVDVLQKAIARWRASQEQSTAK